MKNFKITLTLFVALFAFATLSKAQTVTTLDDVASACQGIVMKNGDVNSTLGGVKPTIVNPAVHAEMVAHITALNGMVATAEAGLAATSNPALVGFRGDLSAALGDLSTSTGYLCWCISNGDLVGAYGSVPVVRNDFQDLRAIATDIRGEIQKGKGGSAH
jgi:hypothetical protein